ncbi:hypothetical protein [Pediococcus pentosaceus]|uniref:hypothetical protein n=1 Tax=Pediococcus pentosaceus TaxID=1255 RepID=UPI001363CF19|nr:hypothetical protein [Pediococcus pentosaceus]QHM64365.1 hypothetical protein C7M48_00068 [Pediococcus pentosaceus]QHM67830.1 hypothetical protein C7M49_01798 [Pediococcus pentosaceus]QHM68016.1 hypothetical protein C7M50_00078 [Pediococcus pentosaceus]
MALIGFTIIIGWLVYKFFTKWLWWCIGFGILVNVIVWFEAYGWIVFMIGCFALAIVLFALAIRNYRVQHQSK